MLGIYNLIVSNKRVKFNLQIDRKITIIQGDSSTGKSYMVDRLADFVKLGEENSGVQVITEFKKIHILSKDSSWESAMSNYRNYLMVIDEDQPNLYTKEFAKMVNNSDNYFLIVARDPLKNLNYSVRSIYRFENTQLNLNGKLYTTTYSVNEYKDQLCELYNPKLVVEDSGMGYDFYDRTFPNKVISAEGNSNVETIVRRMSLTEDVCAIVDGAAFGCYIKNLCRFIDISPSNIVLLMPESFEGVILKSKFFENKLEVESIVNRTYDYCDSREYLSWEQFYTDKLTYFMKKYHKLNYSKSGDSECLEFFLNSPRTVLEAIEGFPMYLLNKNDEKENIKEPSSSVFKNSNIFGGR